MRRRIFQIGFLFLSMACAGGGCFLDPVYNPGDPFSSEFLLTNVVSCVLEDERCPRVYTVAFKAGEPGADNVFTLRFTADGDIIQQPTRITSFAANNTRPSFSPDGSKIAFVSNRTGDNEIWVIHTATGSETRITDSSAEENFPAFARDGTRIFFTSNRGGNFDIWYKNADGSGTAVKLTSGGDAKQTPKTSWDGSLVAFTRLLGNQDIYTIRADGTDLRRVTIDTAADIRPTFAPDGSRIVFQSPRSGNEDLWSIPVGGGPARQLTFDIAEDKSPAFSPDGRFLVWKSLRNGTSALWAMRMDADGNPAAAPRQLTTGVTTDNFPDFGPFWR